MNSVTSIQTPYEDLLARVYADGESKGDRTGTGTISIFGAHLRYDLNAGFPLITSKKVHFKSIVAELLWFLSGDTNVKALQDQGVHIWDEWADAKGDLGPIYGEQWRSWWNPVGQPVDQIKDVIKEIGENPNSRRLIVSAWNPVDIPDMALAPCHVMFQFYVSEDNKLSCQVYQRSADMFLGVPFNIASYALLTHLVADQCGLGVGDLIWTGGDCHIYKNHYRQVETQLLRQVDPEKSFPFLGSGIFNRTVELPPLPKLDLGHPCGRPDSIFDWKLQDIKLIDYNPLPGIKAPVAV